MKKDITGQKFGRLTAVAPVRVDEHKGVFWRCTCECGGEKEVPVAYLMRGTTKSCGCIKAEKKSDKNIAGNRYGRLVAVQYMYTNDRYMDFWLFRCDCGNEKVMSANSVKWGNTRSCGCLMLEHVSNLNRQDIAGQRFDRLVAVKPTDDRDAAGSIVWECKCDCGNVAYYSVNGLRNGKIHSCGCLYHETRIAGAKNRKDFKQDTSFTALVTSKKVRKNNSTGYTGVFWNKQQNIWQAYIYFQKKRYYLGSFNKKELAIEARQDAERRLHDPVIMENWEYITDSAKKEFIAYMREAGEKIPENLVTQPAETTNAG